MFLDRGSTPLTSTIDCTYDTISHKYFFCTEGFWICFIWLCINFILQKKIKIKSLSFQVQKLLINKSFCYNFSVRRYVGYHYLLLNFLLFTILKSKKQIVHLEACENMLMIKMGNVMNFVNYLMHIWNLAVCQALQMLVWIKRKRWCCLKVFTQQ